MYDLVIKNGTVVDGTGSPRFKADVAIKNDQIVAVGTIDDSGAKTVDATGKVVTPGFIDLHTHSDNSFLIDPHADSKLTQGVTLELFGNCGMSYCAPLNENNIDGFKERTDKYDPKYKPGWSTMDGYLTALEDAGSTINVAAQVGHGTVRRAVMGMEPRMPSPEELDRMVGLFA
ncbi:MAG: amidohydrolase family protein, partial [Dehalococcoidia bacterium]